MAWMSDEAWEYTQDSIEKKKTARSYHNMRTHCGKRGGMKTASDFMTKKELDAMNGEVILYPNLKQPMTWAEFKTLPDDIKKEYINWIRDTFGADDTSIADMLGVCRSIICKHFKCWGLNKGKSAGGKSRKWDKEKFLAWSHGADPNAVNETQEEDITDEVNEAPEAAESPVEDSEGKVDWNQKIAEIFAAAEAEGVELGHPDPVGHPGEKGVKGEPSCNCGSNVKNESCEKIAAAPVSGSLAFEDNADRILNMLAMIIGTKKVALHVEWTVVE